MENTIIGVISALICFALFYLVIPSRKTKSEITSNTKHRRAVNSTILVGYASQSGLAERLAWRTANALSTDITQVVFLPLFKVTRATLTNCQKAFFIVSTTGDGDPPDNGRKFVKEVMRSKIDLSYLDYSVLALGDSTYENFCAFGIRLDRWLRRSQATPLHERILVDNADDYALQKWQSLVWPSHVSSSEGSLYDITRWQLKERRALNPNSETGLLFFLSLRPKDPTLPHWKPGDIALVYPGPPSDVLDAHSDLPREYTIASIPESGTLDLIIRQRLLTNGEIGICSRWLTETVESDGIVCLRTRKNPKTTISHSSIPYIFIGAGSGMAGLRAQLQHRVRNRADRNWLIYGDRDPVHDRILEDELNELRKNGYLPIFHQVFSRAGVASMYVQDCLREHRAEVRKWVAEGACIYVCGSYEGMGRNIHLTLLEILGEARIECMLEEGRYCRDTY